ncbi:MAG TPA: alpha/beta hydrolase [Ktedonobacteraceae bacterium]|nr:alpha/beta hydrolase [Ktedonobacteraceae bacterium]
MPTKPVRDDFAIAGNTKLHYVQWGEQGPPVVCIHGLTANAFCFQAIADELASDHRVFAYDLRGRGDSDKPKEGYSVPLHVTDLTKLLDALGLERPVLIGHSLGAMIALYFAAHYPDKLSKLVLIDAGAPLAWKTPGEQPAWLTASIGRLGIPVPSFQEYVGRLKAAPFLGPYWNEYLDIYFDHDVQRNSDGSVTSKCYREGILEEGRRFAEAEPEQQWSSVRVPTLLLRAGQGLFFDNDQLLSEADTQAVRRNINSCQYVNFPTLNHYTIIFGIEPRPAREIRSFIEKG